MMNDHVKPIEDLTPTDPRTYTQRHARARAHTPTQPTRTKQGKVNGEEASETQ